jgi:hypothetical protein
MMSAANVSSLNQQISSGECETSDFNVNWMPSQISQFDPEAANTELTILSLVVTFCFSVWRWMFLTWAFPPQFDAAHTFDVAWMAVMDRCFLDGSFFVDPTSSGTDMEA